MTPPAPSTAAGRAATTATARAATEPRARRSVNSEDHGRLSSAAPRPAVRAGRRDARLIVTAPAVPRRVSGPGGRAAERPPRAPAATGRSAAGLSARALRGAPLTGRPVRPRQAPPRSLRGAQRAVVHPRTIVRRHPARLPTLGLSLKVTLPRPETLLDRIVRGRAWIPELAVMLVGIVAMQVEVLKLGASVGRSMNTASELQGQIQIERARVSELASPARIERLAARWGMMAPGPTDYHFLSPHVSVAQAIAGIRPVDPSAFSANLAAQLAIDDGAAAAAINSVPVPASATAGSSAGAGGASPPAAGTAG
jgi:hypothetical protein